MASRLVSSPAGKFVLFAGVAVVVIVIFSKTFSSDVTKGLANPDPVSDLASQVPRLATDPTIDTTTEDVSVLAARVQAIELENQQLKQKLINAGGNSNNVEPEALKALVQAEVDRIVAQVSPGSTSMSVDKSLSSALTGYEVGGNDSGSEINFDSDNPIVDPLVKLDGYILGGGKGNANSGVSGSEESIEWIVSSTAPVMDDGGGNLLDSIKESAGDSLGAVGGGASEEQNPIQYATIDREAILFDAVLLHDAIGVVPTSSGVEEPFAIKVEIGADNIATSGIDLPHIAKMRMSGYAVGEWSKGCVRGIISSATFVFEDGTIHTVGQEGAKLAYITDEYGDPCIKGDQKVSNFSEYVGWAGGLSALSSVGESIASQQFEQVTDGTSVAQAFTGSSTQNALGSGMSGGLDAAQQAIAGRYANLRDLVIARGGRYVTVHLSQQLNIDWNPDGRKVINQHFEEEVGAYYEAASN